MLPGNGLHRMRLSPRATPASWVTFPRVRTERISPVRKSTLITLKGWASVSITSMTLARQMVGLRGGHETLTLLSPTLRRSACHRMSVFGSRPIGMSTIRRNPAYLNTQTLRYSGARRRDTALVSTVAIGFVSISVPTDTAECTGRLMRGRVEIGSAMHSYGKSRIL